MSNQFPKVHILLSSYNGEKYIEEQIESLFQQDYENLEIFIRDDGSTDRTRALLERYRTNSRIHLFFGENLGFIRSFQSLLEDCGNADYYAFCDQDDVWFPEKITRAVYALEKEARDIPVLYFSNYQFCDAELNVTGIGKVPRNISFANCLVDCAPLGFTSVLNCCARDEIVSHMPQHSCGHDWWAYMVCSGLGKVIYDDSVTVSYRRTGSNVSNGGASFLKFQIWRFKKFFLGDYFLNITAMLHEYKLYYYEKLSSNNRDILCCFTDKKWENTWNKISYPHWFRQGIIDEVFLRCCFLLGKL